jgi:hypothetical protein
MYIQLMEALDLSHVSQCPSLKIYLRRQDGDCLSLSSSRPGSGVLVNEVIPCSPI